MAAAKKKSASRAKKSVSSGKKVPKTKMAVKSKSAVKSQSVVKKKTAKARTTASQGQSKYIPHPAVPSTTIEADAAHMPGHRKLDRNQDVGGVARKIQPAAENSFAQDDKVNRETAQKRISGFVKSAGQRRRRALQD